MGSFQNTFTVPGPEIYFFQIMVIITIDYTEANNGQMRAGNTLPITSLEAMNIGADEPVIR